MAQQKYSILSKIDAGGMAEVWKGKATSLRGFEKLVAIKRVLPNLAANKKFISMFLDEARLSLYLNHANVVQTFDIGMSENAYFIVMEWVDGGNLKSVLDTARERGFRIPLEQAVFICIEICKGLSHAHNRRDPQDRPLKIVHRDISPPNVLLSREGEVKLVDFGLAKAVSQLTQTDPGIVKGKFSYLSPEATLGEEVDERADIFATGIVLWEMLAGRRLFDGETDLKTVELVRAAKIPSLRAYNADVDEQVEAIIHKALARDPRHRFQSSEALGHELARYLFENRLLVTSYDIAVLVKRVLAARDREKPEKPLTSAVEALEATVQEQLGRFMSLEDLERMEFVPVAREGSSEPGLNAEDPRDWATELGVVDGDETILDIPPEKRAEVEEQQARRSAPRSRQISIPPPEERPEAGPPARRADRPPPPPPPRTPPPRTPPPSRPAERPNELERRQRAQAAAEAALRAQAEADGPPSVMLGVVLGVLGASLVGGAAWFFLFR